MSGVLATHSSARQSDALRAAVKRAIDFVVAALALAVLLPLLLLIALLVVLDSRGPVLYRAERAGFRGRRLRMLKFRKMSTDAGGAALTVAGDERLTRLGAWLARTKLDELPQLWHVLRGEMSLVGPRPESSRFVDCYPHEYERILSTRPGIVGLSQLAFVDESRILDERDPVRHYIEEILPHKVELDLLYVERHSVWFDLRILLWSTVAVLLRRPVLVDPATGRVRWGGRP